MAVNRPRVYPTAPLATRKEAPAPERERIDLRQVIAEAL